MFRTLKLAILQPIWRRQTTDAALSLPRDPRPSNRDISADGWSCPATVRGVVCGLPKTPEQETCGRVGCKRWRERQAAEARKREEEAERRRQEGEAEKRRTMADVVGIGRKAG